MHMMNNPKGLNVMDKCDHGPNQTAILTQILPPQHVHT